MKLTNRFGDVMHAKKAITNNTFCDTIKIEKSYLSEKRSQTMEDNNSNILIKDVLLYFGKIQLAVAISLIISLPSIHRAKREIMAV